MQRDRGLILGQFMSDASLPADLVNETYGLTAEEIDLLWETAPPRMPRFV